MFSRPPGLAQKLASDIDQLIKDRGLRSGDRIATMEELRAETGYARATIGETAHILTERGSIEVRPGRGGGLFVADVSPVVRMRQTLLTVPHGATSVADAIAVRSALEELIAQDAAAHRSALDLRELDKCVNAIRRAGDNLEKFLRANWALHERIADITPNSLARAMYVSTIRCVADLSDLTVSQTAPMSSDYLAQRLSMHEVLVAAIRSGDPALVVSAVAGHQDPESIDSSSTYPAGRLSTV
ncbi:MAG: FCD domain-containing protein [Actinomycetota bacterium]|nr:FCD domain-containing protein [Actinomycetota bacterium]